VEQLGEGPDLRVAPELSDPIGAVEIGEHQARNDDSARGRP
jgi:hypothetical protein